MFKRLLAFILTVSQEAMAQTDAAMQINEDYSLAEFAIVEKNISGKLSDFFENLSSLETSNGN